jgi:hypothetical protein
MKLKYVSIALAALVASTAPAQAVITVYTSAAAFNAATTAQGIDTYTGFSITGSTPSPIFRTAGAYGYKADATPTGTFFGGGTSTNPFLSTNTATDTIVLSTFTGGVEAAGGNFFDSDIAGAYALGDITITATDGSGTVTQTIVGATTNSFLGFVSSGSLTSLTIASVQGASPIWPSLDNLVLAKRAGAVVPQVPESSTWLMMIAGFGLVGGAMRRRSTMRIAQAV